METIRNELQLQRDQLQKARQQKEGEIQRLRNELEAARHVIARAQVNAVANGQQADQPPVNQQVIQPILAQRVLESNNINSNDFTNIISSFNLIQNEVIIPKFSDENEKNHWNFSMIWTNFLK